MSRNPLLLLLAVLASFLFTSNAQAVYHVQTGRFLQADPNGTGMPLITDSGWFGGRAPFVGISGFNFRQHYGDGMNHFEYVRSNPINRSDPLGLMSTIELGGVGGIQGMLAGLFNGAASVGTSLSGLMTSGGVWAINTSASGALVVGMNFDAIMMFASNADANWNNWVNELSNWGSDGGGPPRVLQTGGHTINQATRDALNLTREQAKMAMEGLKGDIGQRAFDHGHKIWSNGNVTDSSTGNLLGNLYNYIH